MRLWIVLLIITGLIALWFSTQAITQSWKYIRLNAKAPAQVLKWEVERLSGYQYALAATYSYTVRDQKFTGQTVFSSSPYPNYYAAESDLKLQQGRAFWAWYQKGHPSFSSLYKKFPRKECTNALLTLGVFMYFFFARSFFLHKQEETT
jgi:hypothetical protein